MVSNLSPYESFDVVGTLCKAARDGDVKKLQDCIRAGSNINCQRRLGSITNPKQSPLHFASQYGRIECVRILIEKNAKIDKFDEYGRTALYYARENCHFDCAKHLIKSGASLFTINTKSLFSEEILLEYSKENERRYYENNDRERENLLKQMERENLSQRLSQHNLIQLDTGAEDWSCLLEAVSRCIGLEYSGVELRKMAVENLRNTPQLNGDPLWNFLSTEEKWERYLERMSKDEEWNDHLCLIALSRVLQRPIKLISSMGELHDANVNPLSTRKRPILLGRIFEKYHVTVREKKEKRKRILKLRRSRDASSGSDESDEERENQMERDNFYQRLSDENLMSIETIANGNCLFEAVAERIQFEYSGRELRNMAVIDLQNNPRLNGESLKEFIANERWEEYLERMKENEEWGDNLSLIALSRSLHQPIKVISSKGIQYDTDINPLSIGKEPILLGHIFEKHYVALQYCTFIV